MKSKKMGLEIILPGTYTNQVYSSSTGPLEPQNFC